MRALATAIIALFWAGFAQASPPLSAYSRLPALENPTLSPSGDRIAMVSQVGGDRAVVVRVAGGPVLMAVPIGTAKLRRIYWAGEDHIIIEVSRWQYYRGAAAPSEFHFGIAVNLKDGKTVGLLAQPERSLPYIYAYYGAYERDGQWYGAVVGQAVNGVHGHNDLLDELDVFAVDLDTGLTDTLYHGGVDSYRWVLGPHQEVLARMTGRDQTGSYTVYNMAKQGAVLLTAHDRFGQVELVGPGRAPGTVAVWHHGLVEYSLDTGAAAEVPLEGDLDELYFDRARQRLMAVRVNAETNHLQIFDTKLASRMQALAKAIPGRLDLISWTDDASHMIIKAEGDGDAGTYWLINGHAAAPLGYAYPEVPDADVGRVREFTYPAADGTELHAIVTYPPGPEPRNAPVVVMPHGGPEDHDSLHFDWWAQAIASRGYVVVQPNFRGSAGYGEAFRDKGFGEFGRKMQTDVSDALLALAHAGTVDPKRACIIGADYGGYVALAGVTVQQGLYRCAVSLAGISDLGYFLNEELYRAGGDERNTATRYWKEYLGGSADLGSRSPSKLAAQADAPILLIHGTEDVVVPIQQSREMEAALRKAGKPVEFVTLPKEDHWLSREEGRRAMLDASMAFLLKYNPPN